MGWRTVYKWDLIPQQDGKHEVCRWATAYVLATKFLLERCTLTSITGLIPFLGYHHVLMILIAAGIILLCTSTTLFSWRSNSDLTCHSSPSCRLFLDVARDTKHFPHIPLLPKLSPKFQPCTGRPGSYNGDSEHCWTSTIGSQGGLLRYLHQPRWRGLLMQQQR